MRIHDNYSRNILKTQENYIFFKQTAYVLFSFDYLTDLGRKFLYTYLTPSYLTH